ncbi:glutathione S-transferase family protein [Novosphingobium sp. HII-3]|uniref:glutathione S-transferase family protein n=1 Tax=Novosphingobium sp. HII-3 TaxID=2075565 RepID=UPI000CDB06EF|nr:glutathione S-transferase [Novosphingobium sp. HII-3]
MITIYHLGVSQSDRVVWLMEELGLPYDLVWYDRNEEGIAPPEYLALHPAAMAPVIRDGDRLLAESVAIVQYIAHRYGGGRLTVAPDDENYADYLYWLEFNNNAQCGMFIKGALKAAGHDGGLIGMVSQRRTDGLFQQMDDHLATWPYLAGEEFTLADLMSAFAVVTVPELSGGNMLASYTNIQRYGERVTQRSAWQRAMAIAGPKAKRP